MDHYVCNGGCEGVSEKEGTCQAIACPKFGKPLEKCDCTDGKHRWHKEKEEKPGPVK